MIYEDTSIRVYNNSVFRLVSDEYSLLNHSELALFEGKVIIEADDNLGYSFILNTPSRKLRSLEQTFWLNIKEDLLFNGVDYSIFTVLEGIIELRI